MAAGAGSVSKRQEGGGARALALEKRQRGPGLAKRSTTTHCSRSPSTALDARLEPGRDLEQVGDGADDAGQGRVAGREHRAHAGAVALALALQALERLVARLPRGQLRPRASGARLRLARGGLALLDARAPSPRSSASRAALGSVSRRARLERGARDRRGVGLGACGRQLRAEPLRGAGSC